MLCFIDESGISNPKEESPVFVLGAVLIEEKEHDILSKKLDEIKQEIFGTVDIVIHTAEMTRPMKSSSDERFRCLINKDMRNSFYKQINDLIKNTEMSAVFIIVDKLKLCSKYSDPMDAYEFSMENLINRILWATNSTDVKMFPEQRGVRLDAKMDLIYAKYCEIGTRFHGPEVLSSRIKEFKHVHKSDNLAGSQLVDVLVTPIARDYLGLKQKPKWNEISIDIVKKKIKHPNNLNIFPN